MSFCERLRVKCLPHFSSSEFLALIDRVEKTVHLEEGSAASALKDVKDTQVVQEQKCRLCPNRVNKHLFLLRLFSDWKYINAVLCMPTLRTRSSSTLTRK